MKIHILTHVTIDDITTKVFWDRDKDKAAEAFLSAKKSMKDLLERVRLEIHELG